MTREQELSAAIETAVLPSRDYRIFSALLRQRAEWKTAAIAARFQPRGLAELAALAKMSKATLCRGLEHLASHGWIARERAATRGRGHRTTYQLNAGMDCDCLKQRPEPMTDADRARRYRERKRARNVSASRDEVSQNRVTRPAGSVSESRDEVSQDDVTKCLTSRDEIPGQGQFSAKEGNDEGREEGEREKQARNGAAPEPALCIICRTPMDPVLPKLGYRTHPCCGPDGKPGKSANLSLVNQSTDVGYRRAA